MNHWKPCLLNNGKTIISSFFLPLFTGLLFLVFTLLCMPTFAQNDSLTTQKRSIALKFAPLALIDPLYPAIQAGLEVSLTKKWSIQSELGYIIKEHAFEWSDSTSFPHNRKGFKWRGEIRYYVQKTNSKILRKIGLSRNRYKPYGLHGSYLSAELFYSAVQSTERETFKLDTIYCTETFHEKRKVGGLHLKIGHQSVFKSGLLLDTFIGMGAKYLVVQHPDRQCGGFIDSEPDCLLCYIHDERKRLLPNFTVGLKVGYVF